MRGGAIIARGCSRVVERGREFRDVLDPILESKRDAARMQEWKRRPFTIKAKDFFPSYSCPNPSVSLWVTVSNMSKGTCRRLHTR